jgi:hypothetical protein
MLGVNGSPPTHLAGIGPHPPHQLTVPAQHLVKEGTV